MAVLLFVAETVFVVATLAVALLATVFVLLVVVRLRIPLVLRALRPAPRNDLTVMRTAVDLNALQLPLLDAVAAVVALISEQVFSYRNRRSVSVGG